MIDFVNIVCYFIYVIEMIIKISGLGFESYFKDKFNIFDSIVVLVSTTDFAFFFVKDIDINVSAFFTLRAIRILRIIKMVKSWN